MRIKKLIPFFLLLFLIANLIPILTTEAQTYIINITNKISYFRIPSFSFVGGAITIGNIANGIQMNLTLNAKPATNSFAFNFQSSNLSFYYQPPLNEELNLSQYDFVNATHAFKLGRLIAYRPENVVGSYAVYCNRIDNEYTTGKVFHISRILLVDSLKRTSYANMNLTNGVFRITANQTWLDTASYPVIIDPSFGNTNAGASSNTELNYIFGVNRTLTETATITSITASCSQYGGVSGFIRGAIYNGSYSLVGSGSSFGVLPASQSWISMDISGTLVAGIYFLCTNTNTTGTNTVRYYDSATAQSDLKSSLFSSFPVSSFVGEGGWANKLYSLYVNYTTTAAGQWLNATYIENLFPSAYSTINKALGFQLSGTTYGFAPQFLGKELLFGLTETIQFWDSAIALKAFILTLFEKFEPVHIDSYLSFTLPIAALTLDIAVAIGVLALVLSITGISMVFLRRRRD